MGNMNGNKAYQALPLFTTENPKNLRVCKSILHNTNPVSACLKYEHIPIRYQGFIRQYGFQRHMRFVAFLADMQKTMGRAIHRQYNCPPIFLYLLIHFLSPSHNRPLMLKAAHYELNLSEKTFRKRIHEMVALNLVSTQKDPLDGRRIMLMPSDLLLEKFARFMEETMACAFASLEEMNAI